MISYFQGTVQNLELTNKNLGICSVSISYNLQNAIGYAFFLGLNDFNKLNLDQNIKIYIYHHKNEKVEELYGFLNRDNLPIFKKLINISGVGPKTALQIIDKYPKNEIQQIVLDKNIKALEQISGLGKKTSVKILIELNQDKEFGKLFSDLENDTPSEFDLLSQALKQFGYNQKDINNIIKQNKNQLQLLQNSGGNLEQMIKLVMKK